MTDMEKDSVETINTEKEEAKTTTKKRPSRKKVKTLKDRVCEALGITENCDMDRPQGGVVKFYSLGNIESSLVVKYKNKTIRQFEYARRQLITAEKRKLKEKLGEDYKKLTVENRLFKPRFGAVGSQCIFKVGIYIYGPDFPRIIKKIGRNRNVKLIQ